MRGVAAKCWQKVCEFEVDVGSGTLIGEGKVRRYRW